MSEAAKRKAVRQYLAGHCDQQFRQAVFALRLIYDPGHLDTLFAMAQRGSA